jgi:hypothetical protein
VYRLILGAARISKTTVGELFLFAGVADFANELGDGHFEEMLTRATPCESQVSSGAEEWPQRHFRFRSSSISREHSPITVCLPVTRNLKLALIIYARY